MTITDIINSGCGTVLVTMTPADLSAFANEIVARILPQQSSNPVMEDELLTRQGVMEYLGIKSTTLWAWTKMGLLTPVKIRRKCLYRKSDILSLQSAKYQQT